jgi:hypothetical protein
MKININKAPGPNDPVLKILKEFADVLAAIIINNTLSYQIAVSFITNRESCLSHKNLRRCAAIRLKLSK